MRIPSRFLSATAAELVLRYAPEGLPLPDCVQPLAAVLAAPPGPQAALILAAKAADPERSEAIFAAAEAASPEDPDLLAAYAGWLLAPASAPRDPARAEALLRRALQADPRHSRALGLLAEARLQAGDLEGAAAANRSGWRQRVHDSAFAERDRRIRAARTP